MSDVVSLSEARAREAEDSRLWSPVECVRALLRRMESGEVNALNIAIHWWEGDPDKGMVLCQSNAKLTRPEHLALLVMAQDQAMRQWRGEE